jgi:hypothetical protein
VLGKAPSSHIMLSTHGWRWNERRSLISGAPPRSPEVSTCPRRRAPVPCVTHRRISTPPQDTTVRPLEAVGRNDRSASSRLPRGLLPHASRLPGEHHHMSLRLSWGRCYPRGHPGNAATRTRHFARSLSLHSGRRGRRR